MKTRKNYPRSIRGATRRGYYIVDVPYESYDKHNISWLGLCIWADARKKGHFINNFVSRQFAFESESDASMFILKWL